MSIRASFVLVYLACLALLAVNIGLHLLELGRLAPPLMLGVAASQAFLVAWFFLHVRRARGLIRLAAFAALFWVAVLFGLSLSDYLTRGPYQDVSSIKPAQ